MQTKKSRFVRLIGLLLLIVLSLALVVPTALADDISETKGFRKGVTLAGIREHQAAFQAIAAANNDTRASGTPGYDASAQYVFDKLDAAGYSPSFQEFAFPFFRELTLATLAQTAPGSVSYTYNVDHITMTYSGSGDVTAAVTAVDTTATAGASTSGCEAADFAGFPAGHIALIQRGTCTFFDKASNAQAAGAAGVIIFNQGIPGRVDVFGGTLGTPGVTIPVVGTSFTLGVEFYGLIGSGLRLHLVTDTISEIRTTKNVIAETATGDPNHVIVIGAHLDSRIEGPGINDNGSGSAAILEIAEVFATQGRVATNKLRFIWFGAEELGLLGSNFYVNQLSQAERDRIELNLNFDMVGSPNYVRFIYDGDNSAFPVGPGAAAGPPGSGAIEAMFHDYFASQGLASAETPFSGRSDYGPFIAVGIPAGGLFTGAEGVKTAAEANIFGGTAGVAYDVCYHQACDTFNNVHLTGLDEMSDAVAHTVLLFSKRNFDKQPLVNPATPATGSTSTGGGGGLHDDHDNRVDR